MHLCTFILTSLKERPQNMCAIGCKEVEFVFSGLNRILSGLNKGDFADLLYTVYVSKAFKVFLSFNRKTNCV